MLAHFWYYLFLNQVYLLEVHGVGRIKICPRSQENHLKKWGIVKINNFFQPLLFPTMFDTAELLTMPNFSSPLASQQNVSCKYDWPVCFLRLSVTFAPGKLLSPHCSRQGTFGFTSLFRPVILELCFLRLSLGSENIAILFLQYPLEPSVYLLALP